MSWYNKSFFLVDIIVCWGSGSSLWWLCSVPDIFYLTLCSHPPSTLVCASEAVLIRLHQGLCCYLFLVGFSQWRTITENYWRTEGNRLKFLFLQCSLSWQCASFKEKFSSQVAFFMQLSLWVLESISFIYLFRPRSKNVSPLLVNTWGTASFCLF